MDKSPVAQMDELEQEIRSLVTRIKGTMNKASFFNDLAKIESERLTDIADRIASISKELKEMKPVAAVCQQPPTYRMFNGTWYTPPQVPEKGVQMFADLPSGTPLYTFETGKNENTSRTTSNR